MKNILVTGADGFIGSHLCELLLKEGYAVKAFVYYNAMNSYGCLEYLEPAVLDQIEIFTGDIRDPFGVKAAMKGCDAVMHLAALIGIPYSYHSPDNYIQTNINGTLNIVQAARELQVERVIHTSTSEVYGTAQYVPINEIHPLQPQSPYSATKIAADQVALSYYYSFDLPLTIVRPFNTYGPRQSARAIIPTTILQMDQGVTTIQLGSLEPTRDFNFVTDTAMGFLKALEASHIAGETINLGTGFEISIAHLVTIISEIMDKKVDVVLDKNRVRPEKSEVQRLLADNQKARTLLNWAPAFSDLNGLKKGLEKTIEWFLNPENKRRYKSGIYNV